MPRNPKTLDEYKDVIQNAQKDGLPATEIRDLLREKYNFSISKTTYFKEIKKFKDQHDYDQPLRIQDCKDFICVQYKRKIPIAKIRLTLQVKHNVHVSRQHIYTLLKKWGVPLRQERTVNTDILRDYIRFKYYEMHMSDEELYRNIRSELGLRCSLSGIQKIRKKCGIKRRPDAKEMERLETVVNEYIAKRSRDTHEMPNFGRRSFHHHLRHTANINVSEHLAWKAFRRIYPRKVKEREDRLNAKRGGYLASGPNEVWSVDGYCKLLDFGFEIYAGIDAFSRFIVWFYCGVSAMTTRSVFAQYLRLIGQLGYIPRKIRSDRGKETPMAAWAHWVLSQATKKQRILRSRRNKNGDLEWYLPGDPGGPDFEDCWKYGKSTKNQRIESFWLRLANAKTRFWRDFFCELRSDKLWSKNSLADRIALLYIYMPIIRKEMQVWIREYNTHKIRYQKNLKHGITGIPKKMYLEWNKIVGVEAVDCAIRFPQEPYDQLMRLAEVDGVKLDPFLPQEMLDLCADICSAYQEPEAVDLKRPHKDKYLFLRSHLQEHHGAGQWPPLALLPRPTGGWKVFRKNVREAAQAMAAQVEGATGQAMVEDDFLDLESDDGHGVEGLEEDADWRKTGIDADIEYET
ncbi:hypothetical protein QBC44DRAFT_302540 [Cladorrhinum sp. PSN332]|nr:hypothetical protein QBC44DRAFT_302540 [Cladorrhinum sp. PSN332]